LCIFNGEQMCSFMPGSVRLGRIAANMLRTAERSFQPKNIGHAAEKQFWMGLRIEDFLLAGHKCTV
jgi:hypothetical protein